MNQKRAPEMAGKAIISGPCSGGPVGKEMIVFAFPAVFTHFVRELALSGLRFFGSFFFRKKKEQRRFWTNKERTKNYLLRLFLK
jgi:hypothetical protein